jgi:hypothetical protein
MGAGAPSPHSGPARDDAAYLLTDQKPEPSSGDQATGASRRSRPNSSYGNARAHMSRSVRSTVLGSVPRGIIR